MDAETKADLRVKVRRRVSEYIQKSGLPLNRTGSGETEAVCPNCGQTAAVKKIPLEEHFEFWKCDSCGAEGDAVQYAMHHLRTASEDEALLDVCKKLGVAIPFLPTITARELMEKEFPPRVELIEGMLGPGLYILAGAPKIGKSWLVLQIAHHIKAVANDLLIKNPVAYADKMRKGLPKRKESFTPEEVQLLMENLSEDKIGWSIRLMLATGMRTQEILGLEPRHIAEDGSTITIEQAVVRVKGSIAIGTPKSYDSYRTVPVPELVRDCARFLRETDKKFVWEVGKQDMPCNPSHFARQFKLAVERVEGVRVLTPHCCRHTFVSMMQMLGVDIETIQNIAGHAEIDMTRHYLHVQEPRRQEAARRFSEAFSKKDGGVYGNVLDYKKSS